MSKISELGLGGDFRLDSVAHIDGTWSFAAKCVIESTYSGYISLFARSDEKGLRLRILGSMMFVEAPIIDPDFAIPLNASAQESGFELCKRLLELGFTGCCNQQNAVVATRPEELRVEQLSDAGVIRRYEWK